MTIIENYLKLTEELKLEYGEKSLVLMQVGSFFECYALVQKDGSYFGSLIKEFAEINDMIISRKNVCVGGKNVVMAGFGLAQLEKYIKRLQENGFTIAVYTQDSPSKNTTRSLSCIYSPGTFFSPDISEISNNISCVWIHYSQKNKLCNEQICTGISNVDIYTGKTVIDEYSIDYQNTPTTYDKLEKFISVYNPKEIIIISNLSEEIINQIINFTNIKSLQIHKINLNKNIESNLLKEAKNCQSQKYQEAIMKKFYKNNFNFLEDYYYTCIANQSFCFLLNFIEKHNPHLVEKIDKPLKENHEDKLILANHSLKQLNIISDKRHNGNLGCVQDFLNNCITNIGRREFNYNLLNPTTNEDLLTESYNITEYILKKEKWKEIRTFLTEIKDIEKIKRKIIMNKITPKDFYFLNNNIIHLKKLYKNIKKDNTLIEYINKKISKNFEDMCENQEDFIQKKFNIDKIKNIDDLTFERLNNLNIENVCFINRGIDTSLDEKLKNYLDSQEKLEVLRNYFSNIIQEYEKNKKTGEYIKIHETPKMDPMLIGTKRRISILKNILEKLPDNEINLIFTSRFTNEEETFSINIKNLEFKVHGGNQSNNIIVSSEINKLTHIIQNAKDVLINSIINIYKNIVNEFKKFSTNKENNNEYYCINNLIKFIKECDILQCKGFLASNFNFCKPEIQENDNSFAEFKKIRHCLIERLNTEELYVSNDITIGLKEKGILLYGTNAVGKTSLIKSIGITIIMAQAGLFVPCKSLRYKPYNHIFTRIMEMIIYLKDYQHLQ